MKTTNELIREWQDGPFRLELYDTFCTDTYGKSVLGYRFFHEGTLVFEGEDFCASPLHSIDGDKTVGALLSFLALRPGDTDYGYFYGYTPAQMTFALYHGEELSVCADNLENGRPEDPSDDIEQPDGSTPADDR